MLRAPSVCAALIALAGMLAGSPSASALHELASGDGPCVQARDEAAGARFARLAEALELTAPRATDERPSRWPCRHTGALAPASADAARGARAKLTGTGLQRDQRPQIRARCRRSPARGADDS